MNPPAKRLYRSRTEQQVAGICGGLGAYLGVDPVVLRLILVAVTVFSGGVPGVVTYLAAWFVVPLEPLPLQTTPAQPPVATEQPSS